MATWEENLERAKERARAVHPLVKCPLSESELVVLLLLKEHGWIPSSILKTFFGVEGRKPALTKANFPNIRQKLRSYMNATRKGMCRGGYLWFSAIEWKEGLADFKQFASDNSI